MHNCKKIQIEKQKSETPPREKQMEDIDESLTGNSGHQLWVQKKLVGLKKLMVSKYKTWKIRRAKIVSPENWINVLEKQAEEIS